MSINLEIAQNRVRVMKATRAWRFVDMKELWEYRDLLWLFVMRDITVRYRQTALGPAWFILQPLLTSLIFVVIFSRVAKIPTAGVPPMLFYLSAQLGWQYFSNAFTATSNTLVSNAHLFGKIYFPRLLVPISTVISNLLAFVIQFGTFLGIYAFMKNSSNVDPQSFNLQYAALALMPLIVLQFAAISLGVGLMLSALTAKYRDFGILSSFILQLWMYVTPVIYPLSHVPDRIRPFVLINPLSAPVESLRHILLGTVAPSLIATFVSVVITVITIVAGIFVFRRVEKTFVDVI